MRLPSRASAVWIETAEVRVLSVPTVPRSTKHPEALARRIEDLFVILQPDMSELHSLNSVATRIWTLIEEERTVADVAAAIADEYEVDEATARGDVLELLGTLREKQLIVVK